MNALRASVVEPKESLGHAPARVTGDGESRSRRGWTTEHDGSQDPGAAGQGPAEWRAIGQEIDVLA